MKTRSRHGHSRIGGRPLGGHAGVEQYDSRALEGADRGVALEETVGPAVVYEIGQDTDDALGVLETSPLHADALAGVDVGERGRGRRLAVPVHEYAV